MLEELSQLFTGKKKTVKVLKGEKKLNKDLVKRIDSTEKELLTLADQAQTLAADLNPKTTVNKVLDKVLTRERKLHGLESDIAKPETRIDFINDLLKERQELIISLKQEIKEIADKRVKDIDLKKAGKEKVSRYVDGIREDWIVPRDIGAAMKNLDVKELGFIGKILSIPTQILKASATRFNPDFVFRNPARDIQTAKIVSKTGISGTDWVKMLLSSKGKNGQLLELAERESQENWSII